MKAKAHIVSERHDSYMGKKGKVEQVIVSCLDLDPDHAFLNTFDFVWRHPKFRGKPASFCSLIVSGKWPGGGRGTRERV